MVDFVLDDFSSETAEFLFLLFEGKIMVFDFNAFITCCWPFSGQGQAAFGSLVRFCRGLEDNRIQHGKCNRTRVDCDDALFYADHIGGEADTMIGMGGKCIQQVLGDNKVCAGRWLGFLA